METIQIQKTGAVGFSAVSIKDFYGALRSGYVNSVEDVIQINGESYALSTATSLYGEAGSAVGAAIPVEIDYRTGGNKRVVLLTTNALGGDFTLGDGNMIGPLDNREITFILVTKVVNNAIIIPANIVGAANITLTEEGQTVTLIYNEVVEAWTVKALFNATSTDTFAREYIENGILIKEAYLIITTNDISLIAINLVTNDVVAQIIMPNLTVITTEVVIEDSHGIINASLSALNEVSALIRIQNNSLLETINLSELVTCPEILISSNPLLTALDLGSLVVSSTGIVIDANNISSIILGDNLECLSISFFENAIIQSGVGSIDDILNKIDQAGFLNGVLSLEGGTNATPSVAGLVSKANLVIKGWVVTHN
ncbi:MAG: hypothetical protein Q7W13_13015 [Bacteroidia bacterium]|nr:hypothetical protein [Bacteroidia bacterium]